MTMTPARSDSAVAQAANRDAVFPASNNLRLFGYSFRESGGAAAQFRIRNNPVAGAGVIVRNIVLAANQEQHEWFGPNGILCENGISVERVAGAADQSINAAGG
jgi:hypothetical protein